MKFIVNSAILPAGMDTMACAVGTNFQDSGLFCSMHDFFLLVE
jgi:hypothetical protein